jgi:hypothetical protein
LRSTIKLLPQTLLTREGIAIKNHRWGYADTRRLSAESMTELRRPDAAFRGLSPFFAPA